jgi:hypothetical protein
MYEKKTDTQEPDLADKIPEWIENLGSKNKATRLRARTYLIKAGNDSVPPLIELLKNKNTQYRWESARALAMIKSPSAATALVETLEDDDHDVRWAAMEALIALGRDGLEALLLGLTKYFDSIWFRQGAHHILRVLKKQNQLTQPSLEIIQALEGVEPEIAVPLAAEAAWEHLFGFRKTRQS